MLKFLFDAGQQHTEALGQAADVNEIMQRICTRVTFYVLQIGNKNTRFAWTSIVETEEENDAELLYRIRIFFLALRSDLSVTRSPLKLEKKRSWDKYVSK